MTELQSQNIEYWATILGIALASLLCLIALVGMAKTLIFDKEEPEQLFVADQASSFLLDAKKVKIAYVDLNEIGGFSVFLCISLKKSHNLIEIPCESKERGLDMIYNISKLLPKVETV